MARSLLQLTASCENAEEESFFAPRYYKIPKKLLEAAATEVSACSSVNAPCLCSVTRANGRREAPALLASTVYLEKLAA